MSTVFSTMSYIVLYNRSNPTQFLDSRCGSIRPKNLDFWENPGSFQCLLCKEVRMFKCGNHLGHTMWDYPHF